MSEPIPEAIPTSADPRSRRPIKRARIPGSTNPNAKAALVQANEIETLFLDPAREVKIPPPASSEVAKRSIPAPPEIVANVQGSSAGAGSGEFHVYKASRRREYERLRIMDEEAKKEEEDREWAEKERERKERDEEKTRKNRERRNKKRKGKDKSKSPAAAENGLSEEGPKDKKPRGNLAVPVPVPARAEDAESSTDFGVAAVVQESGITIHDDD
ncbi:hypothetical protein A1O7_09895 [Cladophialophora yegresii CBS 114405]|uniref:PRKR-interacting protein 1 n=1 Tax=Cladophialophora yegresii CBS 114405 TaxID=1182544 RepID=W9W7M1_9EURO|nr:uncharacterized protein A1O7_09895 [Cladophialophora yegresii CBS 114405]EXJ54554.1 hypothetical protein A1O7_09895 [Cladophialophora yegresii CBS 114405]